MLVKHLKPDDEVYTCMNKEVVLKTTGTCTCRHCDVLSAIGEVMFGIDGSNHYYGHLIYEFLKNSFSHKKLAWIVFSCIISVFTRVMCRA